MDNAHCTIFHDTLAQPNQKAAEQRVSAANINSSFSDHKGQMADPPDLYEQTFKEKAARRG